METSVKLVAENIGDIIVVSLTADALNIANATAFEDEMENLIEPGAKIVLDLSHLRFLDSTGIGLIRFWHEKLCSSGGLLKLCSLTKQVHSVFELIKLDRILNIYKTREEAYHSFEQ